MINISSKIKGLEAKHMFEAFFICAQKTGEFCLYFREGSQITT